MQNGSIGLGWKVMEERKVKSKAYVFNVDTYPFNVGNEPKLTRRMWDALGGVAQMKLVVEIQQNQVSFLRAPFNLRNTEGWMLS